MNETACAVTTIAVIFDLDGRLVDSLPDLRAALNGVLLGLGRRQLATSEVRAMIGDGTRALVQRALGATGGVVGLKEAHRVLLEFYGRGLTQRSRLFPGVRETLAALRRSGARLGICTNKAQAMSMAMLQAFGITDDFTAVLGSDAVPLKKA